MEIGKLKILNNLIKEDKIKPKVCIIREEDREIKMILILILMKPKNMSKIEKIDKTCSKKIERKNKEVAQNLQETKLKGQFIHHL